MSEQNNNQNDSGGGLFLFIIDWIFDIINRRKIRKYNKQARGLEEYKSITTDILFPCESYNENIIVSGGDAGERLRFSERIIQNSSAKGRPMIILHLGNTGLENIAAQNNLGVIASMHSKNFDAFTSFEQQEICQVVLDTCKSKYDIKPYGRYILQIVYELLACQKIRPYFSNYADFTYHQLSEKINDCFVRGLITQTAADNLNSLLMMGQTECAKIDSFFYDSKAQMGHIATNNANITGGTSVLSAIKKGKTLCVDLKSSANTMLVELIVNSITIAMNRGYEFSIFLDDVAVANNEALKNMLCQKSNHNNIICSKDLYALLNGKEDVFTNIAGEAEKTVLLSHGSHIGCEKWSKYIGEYDKIDVSHNTNGGWSQSSKWGYNSNQGKTMKEKREYKVKPEQINRLSHNEIFIYDNQTGSLIQTKVI
ncbi:MAG: hypothetical protein LBH98_09230 [Chitinispirillales bacterium]|jgi:hypothetical protein|nr:hypothetical protein [Chitinispirillales bacterium]